MKDLSSKLIIIFTLILSALAAIYAVDNSTDPERVRPDQKKKLLINDNNLKTKEPVLYIYNFHSTRRCVSCIAIEKTTTSAIDNHFQKEVESGRIKRFIVNVEDKKNKKLAEKYEVFGTALYLVRIQKGKETIVDLTAEGFKYAKNKPEKLEEILIEKISENLK
jgi:thiol:disulfide interchange protein